MDKELYPDLIEWMRNKRILNRYSRAIKQDGEFKSIKEAMRLGRGFIDNAFIWDATAEGDGYWDTIHAEFIDFFDFLKEE